MPVDKKPSDRLLHINRLLNLRKGAQSVVKFSELMDTLSIGERQLRKDFEALKERGAPLEYDAKLRGWRYTHPFSFSESIPLSAEDLMHLRIAVETLSVVNHLDDFKKLPEIFDKIRRSVERWVDGEAPKKSIFFSPLPAYSGSVHLAFFLQAIENSHRVSFEYQSFHSPAKAVVFDPYFLRHHDRRWYVGGFSHDPAEGFVRTFPLERIVGSPKQLGYYHDKPPHYNPENYWKNIYGITVPPHGKIEDVELRFNYVQGRYFETAPFFTPYQIIERTSDSLTVRLRLIPNFELTQKLASYGSQVVILRPESLAQSLKVFHKQAFEQYATPSCHL